MCQHSNPVAIGFTASSGTATEDASAMWPRAPLTMPYTVTGSATLVNTGSTVPITFNGADSTPLTCGGTACPATFGFWKHHTFPTSVLTSGLTIGGMTYSPSDLLTILDSPGGGNAVTILGPQLVAALLNLAAGAQHNPSADGAIATAEALLSTFSLDLLTSDVDPSTFLGQALITQKTTLDSYNSADFHACSEGSGLQTGPS